MLQEILDRVVKREELIYSKTIFQAIAKDTSTDGKSFKFDVIEMRESYALG